MAIVLDAATDGGQGFGNTRTFGHTIGDNEHRILLVGFATYNGIAVNSIRFAGVDMEQVGTILSATVRARLYRMVNPPAGLNNVVVNWSANTQWGVGAVTYDGVDPVSFGTVVTNNGNSNTPSVVAASADGELVVDSVAYRIGNSNLNPGALQTERVDTGSGAGDTVGHGQSDEPGQAVVTMSWTITAGAARWAIVSVPLKPFTSTRGRATKYFFPFWDANPKLFDANGKIVDPSDILADEWVEAEGLGFPTAENPESFIEDPSRSKIIEVNASQASARIKTNTNQFAEVLVSRVAAGS